jgi:ubiquinone/menaquinone biosynthesis C-methylase UbiE
MTVMDFGCGMGLFSIAMARLVAPNGTVIAVDVQPQMLAVLRRRAGRAGVLQQIRTHLSQPDSLGLDEPVDFVLAFYAAHEVTDLPRLLRELHNCLRPGCSILLVEPIIHVSAREFRQMLATAEQLGLVPGAGPRVRLSHSSLLTKAG